MNKRHALLTCIEVFKVVQEFYPTTLEVLDEVIKRCEDAMALPEPEPVAYRQHIKVTKHGVITHEYGYSDIQIMQGDDALYLRN